MATPKSTTSNFTYGAGNPKGVPTVTQPAPTSKSTPKSDTSGLIPGTGLLDLTLPQNAASARLQAQADAYFAANPNIDPLTGAKKVVTETGLTPEQIAAQSAAAAAAAASAAAAAKDAREAAAAQAEKERQGKSAYSLLLSEFNKYGLGTLVTPLQDLIKQGLSKEEFSLALQNTDAYKKRFAANTDRIAKGLSALSPAEYIGLEDQYQSIMRNYGLPASYYTKGDLGIQEGFNKLLANDVSATELEDRVMTAQSRVINANPEIKQALRSFYPDITDGDILAYTLDPTKALTDIKRKVTAAEIGGAALGAGLKTSQTAAEGLAGYGVTKDQAQKGYSAIAEFLPTGQKLSEIYQESPYTQTQAEQEIFNLANSAEAAKKRKRLSQLETGSFSGSSGAGSGALNRDRAASNQTFGAGAY
jgi:hypothetical protein